MELSALTCSDLCFDKTEINGFDPILGDVFPTQGLILIFF